MTFADIPESRIGVRDDWETASGAIEQTKKVIIKKCGISLPKVRDDLCRYSLDSASKCGMTEWAHRGCGMTRHALRGIGEGIKKEPEGCLFDFLPAHLLRWRLPTLPLAQYHRRDGA